MDSLTHTVLGACMGEAIAGKQLGKKAMLIGAIVNNVPDIDMLANFWTTPAHALLTHRGITHSIAFAIVASPVLIYLFKKTLKEDPLTYKHWLLLVGHGLFLHILMDAFTSYGTGWFEPFHPARVSFNTLFILDPFFMFPLLVTSVSLLFLKQNNINRRRWFNRIGISLSVIYLLVTILIKLRVNNTVEQALTKNGHSSMNYMASPTPMNNLLWYAVIKKDNNYLIGYYSILDKSRDMKFELICKNDSLLQAFRISEDVQRLIRFSKDYYNIDTSAQGIVFSDMRFGLIGNARAGKGDFVFRFDILKDGNRQIIVKQAAFKPANSKDLKALIDRIKGI